MSTWLSTSNFPDSRTGGMMIKLPSGKVLLVGGYNLSGGFTTLATCALYTPGTQTWAYTGSLNTARTQCSLVLLGNGLVLAIGGNANAGTGLTSCELYNPNTELWSVTGAMATGRTRIPNFLLGNGTVLVAGGCTNTSGGSTTACEIYDPNVGTWSATGSLPTSAFGVPFGMLGDGRPLVLSYSGATGAAYTYASGTWTTRAAPPISMTANDTNPTATMPNGDVIIMCPERASSPFNADGNCYIYRKLTNTWSTISGPATAHAGSPYVLADGRILLAGGLILDTPNTSSVKTDIFDPNSETWSSTADLPYAGELAASAGMITQPVLNAGQPLWACPEINGGTIPTSNSSLIFQETTSMATTKLVANQLTNTAVTPGAYTSTNLTVDAQGRITAAASGSAGTTSIVQKVQTITVTSTDITANSFQNTAITASITPTSSSNKIKISVTFDLATTATASSALATINGTANGNLAGGTNGFCSVYGDPGTAGVVRAPIHLEYYDAPATTSAQTYTVQIRNTDNATHIVTGDNSRVVQVMILEEIAI